MKKEGKKLSVKNVMNAALAALIVGFVVFIIIIMSPILSTGALDYDTTIVSIFGFLTIFIVTFICYLYLVSS